MDYSKDEQLTCADCGASFLFTAAEANFYAERNLASPPKRCKECRRARKEQRERGGEGQPRYGRAPSRDDAPAAGMGRRAPRDEPRYTGGADEYRAPMQDNVYFSPPAWGRGGAPAQAQSRGPARPRPWGAESAPRAPSFGGEPAYRSEPFRGDSPRPNDERPQAAGGYRAPFRSARGGPGEYRSAPSDRGFAPRTPASNGEYRAPAFRDAAPSYGERGARDDYARPAFRADRAPSGGRGGFDDGPRRPPNGPMFDITCRSCGVQARVPFQPAEGRDVYCQACYRARKPARHDGGHGRRD